MVESGSQLTLIETPIFAKRRAELLEDEQYRLLQLALVRNPEAGAVIPGSNGVRKLRWQMDGRGKRGGARVIYYWVTDRELILLLFLYPKNERADLTRDQVKVLAKLVKEEFK